MSKKPPAAGAARHAPSRQPRPRARRQKRGPDWHDRIDEEARREARLQADAIRPTLAAMPPEVREEIERHEREILEEDEREERERRNEVRRLRLSELEGALFLIVTDYNEYSTRDLIESLYRVKWDALGPLQRRRYRGRLRARLHSLNCKLKAARQKPLRPSKELNDTRPLGASPLWATVRTRRERERETLASCENEIRKALAGGEMNSWEFNELLQDQKGYRPGTLKRARKRLGVRCKREGYGTDGGWLVYLPPD